MNNIILTVGDSGSTVNFIRNLITLDDSVHWPHVELPKLEYISKTAYPKTLKNNLHGWMGKEYQLRNWERVYGIDVSNDSTDEYKTVITEQVKSWLKTHHVTFMVHWLNVARSILHETPDARVITISPDTTLGFQWQIRAFIEKCGIDHVPNYTFKNDIEHEKQQFIKDNGIDVYRKTNAENMYHIIQSRIGQYKFFGQSFGLALNLEELFTESAFKKLVEKINNHCGININIVDAIQLRESWWRLHWPLEETGDYKWLP